MFADIRCSACGNVSRSEPIPTLSPGVVLVPCPRCGKKGPGRVVDAAPAIVSAKRAADDFDQVVDRINEALGADTTAAREAIAALVDDASGMATLPDVPGDPGDTEVCPSCGEAYSHDGDCPEPDRVQRAYLEWRRTPDGVAVVHRIRRRALELRRRGFRHYGIQAIAEVVRFDRSLEVGPDQEGYKVNNSHLSRLSRDLMTEEPSLRDFFEVRDLRARP